jgi:hypothetical protein
MNKKELIKKLKNEKNELAQKIMALSNAIYFNDDAIAKDLMREQREAMDKYLEALEARILDMEYEVAIRDDLSCTCDCKKKEEPKLESNFIDRMCDELNERVDELIDLVHRHNHKDDSKTRVPSMEDLEGREIINTNPPHCHECENDGTGCVKIILPGNKHLCAK